jgi:phosphate transport system ATP-binding protein
MEFNIIKLNKVNFFYGQVRALTDISMKFEKNKVTALIGPSGCGKSTLLTQL